MLDSARSPFRLRNGRRYKSLTSNGVDFYVEAEYAKISLDYKFQALYHCE
ncbi:MAG TPA: hypothetical protein VF390_00315 [Patescibacteria group bacterium]